MAKVTRSEAREIALKVLFSFEFNKEEEMTVFFDETCDNFELIKNDFSFELFARTILNVDEEDAYIKK